MKYTPQHFSDIADTAFGEKIWGFLASPDSIIKMITAAKLKRPSVEAIDEDLVAQFGKEVKNDRVKQMVGHMVRQIMEQRGFRFDKPSVRISNGVLFSSGAKYKKA